MSLELKRIHSWPEDWVCMVHAEYGRSDTHYVGRVTRIVMDEDCDIHWEDYKERRKQHKPLMQGYSDESGILKR